MTVVDQATVYGATVAPLQTLGAPTTIATARLAERLGYDSLWVAEANGSEAFSLLGAVSVAAGEFGVWLARGIASDDTKVATPIRIPKRAQPAIVSLRCPLARVRLLLARRFRRQEI